MAQYDSRFCLNLGQADSPYLIKLKKILKNHKIHLTALIAVGVFAILFSFFIFQSPLKVTKELVIDEGLGMSSIADLLKEEGVISNKFLFIAYTTVTGNEKKLQAGRYLFEAGNSIFTVVNLMTEGYSESDDLIVVIPEGYNIFDIDNRLASTGLIKKGELARGYYYDEGQFFPDTYRFKKEGSSVDEIAKKMESRLNVKFKDLTPALSAVAFRNILVKASILEKEARKEEDMRLVAGVIQNRLARKMPLQIDATVSYGACLRISSIRSSASGQYKYCNVAQIGVANEIKIDGPYNTYTRSGLPAGPISNPGIAAIRAVLNPIKSDYFYYLSTRDGSRIIFSKTAAEHETNRQKYLGL